MRTDNIRNRASIPILIVRWVVMLCLLAALVVLGGCAATSNAVTDEEIVTNQKPMSSYTSLLLRDFELKREFYSDGDDRMGEREQRYARIPEQLTERFCGMSRPGASIRMCRERKNCLPPP